MLRTRAGGSVGFEMRFSVVFLYSCIALIPDHVKLDNTESEETEEVVALLCHLANALEDSVLGSGPKTELGPRLRL